RPPADPLLVTLVLVGLSHRVAPVELRERVALAPDEAAALARELGEAVCLSTCNRTEVYLATDEPERDEARSVDALAASAGVPGAELRPSLYRLRDEAAALHLFRVAAGLDSMVPGEGEILGQVRSAYETGAAGSFLDRLFRQALHAGKRVRAQTAIGENPVSVPAAAAARRSPSSRTVRSSGPRSSRAGTAARRCRSSGCATSSCASTSWSHPPARR